MMRRYASMRDLASNRTQFTCGNRTDRTSQSTFSKTFRGVLMKRWIPFFFLTVMACARADGERDNLPGKVRPIPPPGIDVPADKKAKLESGLAELNQLIDALRAKNANARDLLPDVEIVYRAAHDGLVYREFLNPKEIDQ